MATIAIAFNAAVRGRLAQVLVVQRFVLATLHIIPKTFLDCGFAFRSKAEYFLQ